MTKNNQGPLLSRAIMQKLFHLSLIFLPFGYYFLGKWPFLQIIAPVTLVVFASDYFSHKNKVLKKLSSLIFRHNESQNNDLGDLTWTLLAACLVFLASKKEIAIISFLILVICVLVSSISDKVCASRKFFEKTIIASSSFYFSGLVTIFFAASFFSLGLAFYFFAILCLFATMIIYARPSLFKASSNFTIPVSFAIFMTIFDAIWQII